MWGEEGWAAPLPALEVHWAPACCCQLIIVAGWPPCPLPPLSVQVRECATALLQVAKRERIPVFLVGHVTKSGDLAGGWERRGRWVGE